MWIHSCMDVYAGAWVLLWLVMMKGMLLYGMLTIGEDYSRCYSRDPVFPGELVKFLSLHDLAMLSECASGVREVNTSIMIRELILHLGRLYRIYSPDIWKGIFMMVEDLFLSSYKLCLLVSSFKLKELYHVLTNAYQHLAAWIPSHFLPFLCLPIFSHF